MDRDAVQNNSDFKADRDVEVGEISNIVESLELKPGVFSRASFKNILKAVRDYDKENEPPICSDGGFNRKNDLSRLTYENLREIAEEFANCKGAEAKSVLHIILVEYHNSNFTSDLHFNSQEGESVKVSLENIGDAINWLTDHQLPNIFKYEGEDNRIFLVRDLFFLAVIDNRKKLADWLWQQLDRDQLATAVIASFLWKSCSEKLKDREAMFNLSRQMHKKAEKYEARAMNILNECFKEDPAKAQLLLVYSMDEWDNRTVLSMAYAGEQMDFFAHDCCQQKLNESWYGELQSFTPMWKIAIGIFFPLFVLCGNMLKSKKENKEIKGNKENNGNKDNKEDKEDKGSKGVKESRERRDGKQNGRRCKCFGVSLYDFYSAPIVKFCTYTLSYLTYLALFSIVMLTQLEPKDVSVFEYLVWIWACSMYVDELRLMFNGWKAAEFSYNPFKNEYFDSWWNLYDQFLFVLMVLAVVLRYSLPIEQFEGTLNVYALAFVFYVLRIMQNFYVVQALGPKIEIIYRMLKDLFIFLLIFVLFMFAFGIAFQALVHPNPSTFKSLSVTDGTILLDLFKHIIYLPYFVIVQQFDGLKDQVENCTSLNYSSMDTGDDVSRCSKLATVLYVVYTLISSLLLVNLLIATFSGSYEQISQDATKTWLYYRFEIISEFIEKPVLPPPLNVVNHVWRLITFCIRHCGPSSYETLKRFHDLKLRSGHIKKKYGIEAVNNLQRLQSKAFDKIKNPNYFSPEDKSSDMYKFKKALEKVEQRLNKSLGVEVPDVRMISEPDTIPNLSHGTMRSDGLGKALWPRGNNIL